MSTANRRAAGLAGGLGVTALLLAVLLAGTVAHKAPELVPLHGAVSLSSIQDAAQEQEQIYSTKDVPKVQPLEKLATAQDMTLEDPRMDMDASSMDLDLAPELAGTMSVAGVPALAEPGGLAAPGGGALTLGEVDEQPRALYAPPPLYPVQEKARAREYTVHVRILLRKDGTVAEAEPLRRTQENAAFLDAAVQAVMQWRFVPCRKGGEPVQCLADQPFSFTLAK